MARVCMVVYNNYVTDPRVRREAEALVERGDSVDCICLSFDGIASLNGVRIFYMDGKKYRGNNPLRLLLQNVLFFVYAFLKVSIEHLRKPYDIVQAHTMPDFLIFTGLIPKLLGARLVLDMHDLMPEMYMSKYGERGSKLMVALFTFIERRSVAFADRTIAVHKPHLDALVAHGNPREKYSILINVPDHRIFTPRAQPKPRGNEFRLLYHGTIPKRAGLEVAVRAVAKIRGEIPNLQFHIVGRGEFVPALNALIKELNLGDCVAIKPTVSIEDLPKVIAEADIGIVPYTADAFTRYVLPTKLLEYAATGCPAIVSRLPSVEAYFTPDMVAYFEPGNVDDLAHHILRLYRNPDAAQDLAVQAAKFTAAYNWPQHRQVYFKLIDSLMPAPKILINTNSKGELWRKRT